MAGVVASLPRILSLPAPLVAQPLAGHAILIAINATQAALSQICLGLSAGSHLVTVPLAATLHIGAGN